MEIDPSWSQPSRVEHSDQLIVAIGLLSSDDRHRERSIAASTQQSIGNTSCRQHRAHHNPPSAGRNRDAGFKATIQLIAEHLDRCGVTGSGVPWTFAQRLDAHQVIGVIRRLKTVLDGATVKTECDWTIAGIRGDQGQCEQSAPTTATQFVLVIRVVLVMHVHPEFPFEGEFGIAQRSVGLRRDGRAFCSVNKFPAR